MTYAYLKTNSNPLELMPMEKGNWSVGGEEQE